MKFFTLALGTLIFLSFSQNIFAQTKYCSSSSMNKSNIPLCRDTAVNASPGATCRTTDGYIFKRYEKVRTGLVGWEDLGCEGHGGIGGKIWFDTYYGIKVWKDDVGPEGYCNSLGLRLPTGWPLNEDKFFGHNQLPSDIEIGISHGLSQVLNPRVERYNSLLTTYGYFDTYNDEISGRFNPVARVICVGVSSVNKEPKDDTLESMYSR